MELRDMSRTMDQSNSETMAISSNIKQMLQDIHSLKQALDPQIFVPELASLMQRRGFRSLVEHRDGTKSSQSFDQGTTYTNVPPSSNVLACGRKGTCRRRISRTVHKVLFLDVEVTTFEAFDTMNGSQGTHCITSAITTETHIRLRFPLSQRTTSLRILREAFSPYATRTLTTYNTVSRSSPLYQAIITLDLCEMRRLFVNGLASPRDRFVYEWGSEDTVLERILWLNYFCEPGAEVNQKLLDMLEYLLKVAPPSSEKSRWVSSLLSPRHQIDHPDRNWMDRHWEDIQVAKLRLLEQYCPAEFWEDIQPRLYLDAEANDDSPIHRFVEARDGHLFDLKNRFMEMYDGIYFFENTRHMLEDASGSGLLLAVTQNYPYWPVISDDYGLIGQCLIARLLGLCAKTTRGDLIQCCQTRITILINHGYYTNYLRGPTHFKLVKQLHYALQPMEFAIKSNTFQFLHDALLNAGWAENKIQASLDDATYAGIPQLFGGIQYMSRDECRKEFIQGLCQGDYLHSTKDPDWDLAVMKLALSLGMDSARGLESMILEANASYSQRSTPGSWLVEPVQQLIPGIDFDLPIYFPATMDRCEYNTESAAEWPCVQAILHQHGIPVDTFIPVKVMTARRQTSS
ncbi:hypothetical protein ACMFMF_000757 [Clarireedia jacksonii]